MQVSKVIAEGRIKNGEYSTISMALGSAEESYHEHMQGEKRHLMAARPSIPVIDDADWNIIIALSTGATIVLRYRERVLREFTKIPASDGLRHNVGLNVELEELEPNKPVSRPTVYWIEHDDPIILRNDDNLVVRSPSTPDAASVRVGIWYYSTKAGGSELVTFKFVNGIIAGLVSGFDYDKLFEKVQLPEAGFAPVAFIY